MRNPGQFGNFSMDIFCTSHQISNELFINFKMAFVLCQISSLMAFGKCSPNCCIHAKGMGQSLEYDIAAFGPVTMPA